MECEPTEKVEVVNVAWPFVRDSEPSVVEPSLNVTVPVGVPLPDVGLTVAVNVTDWPNTAGLAEEATDVTVVGCPIPVPLKDTVEGTTLKPFEMLTLPGLEPVPLGVKATVIVQVPLTGSGDEEMQLSVSEKSPAAATLSIFSAPLPVLVTVSCWGLLLAPTFALPKLSEVGDTVITGGGTVTGTVVVTLWPLSV